MQVIELSGDERYRGLLDPLVIAPPGLREDLASSYLTELLPHGAGGLGDADPQGRQGRAGRRSSRRACGCCELLAVSDEPGRAGRGRRAGGVGGLRDRPARVQHRPARRRGRAELPVTTIKARGLSLPSPGVPRADYDQAERLGVATLKLIAAYAMRLISGDRSVHKVVLFDEAWFLLASRDGRRLIDRLNRLGRAENATLILATQQLADVGEIENLIGTRLIFGQETLAEARRALELLGLDPDDRALVERVRGYRKGRCLMRDITDQVAEVQIDPIQPHLLEVLDTTPNDRGRGGGGGRMTRLARTRARPARARWRRRRSRLVLVSVPVGGREVPRHRRAGEPVAGVAARRRVADRSLPAVGVRAGFARRRRRDRARAGCRRRSRTGPPRSSGA